MECKELLRLLTLREQSDAGAQIITHLRTCEQCLHGIVRLSRAILQMDALSCEQVRLAFPAYYETLHPEYVLFSLPEREVTEVAIHMGHCEECREIYQEFVWLAALEEQGGL